jgi:hypothetical protein
MTRLTLLYGESEVMVRTDMIESVRPYKFTPYEWVEKQKPVFFGLFTLREWVKEFRAPITAAKVIMSSGDDFNAVLDGELKEFIKTDEA